MANAASVKDTKDVLDTSDIVSKAKEFLALLPSHDITFVETGPGSTHGLPGAVTGSFRIGGQALIVPVPESASMIAAFPNTVQFFVEAPEVIKSLISALDEEKA